jgi:SAM-dependent methyltransferase
LCAATLKGSLTPQRGKSPCTTDMQIYPLARNLVRFVKRPRALVQRGPSADVTGSDVVRFLCNVCGKRTAAAYADVKARERPSCTSCGSNLRFRTMMAGLSLALFDDVLPVPEFPKRKDIVGIGLSDSETYALQLDGRLGYTNTYFHKKPFLDITKADSSPFGNLDFLISSDVFEHVSPPIERAFCSVRNLLKTGGALVLSVPFIPGTTREHYPDLHEFKLEDRDGRWKLFNRTRAGIDQEFTDLVFHGGPGATLEMRLFGFDDLKSLLRETGFSDPVLLDTHRPQFGIDWRGEICSIPLVATAI